jgi:hypothetical protein
MRPRKWVLALFILCLALFAALYLVKKRLEKNRDLENLLIQSISPLIKGSINVGKVRLGFFSAHLYDISLIVPLESFLIRINHIKVGFSFKELVVHKGDISKAINRIIFIDPEILFSIAPHKTLADRDTPPLGVQGGLPPEVPDELPVPHILVKNGKILMTDRENDTILIGHKLRGTVTDQGDFTSVNLAGRSGSNHENFYADGNIGWHSGVHSFKISIADAQVVKPIAFENGIITTGTISGELSIVFSDTIEIGRVKTSGNLAVQQGTIILEQLPVPLESVSLSVSASESRWTIDTLAALYRRANLKLNGFWNPIDTPLLQFDFVCSGIHPDSLLPGLPANIGSQIGGDGWITGMVCKKDSVSSVKIHLRGEGFDVGICKNIRFSGSCGVNNSFSHLEIDSFSLYDGNLGVNASGAVDIDSPYVFDITFKGNADILPDFQGLRGDMIKIQGRVWGMADDPKINARVSGANLRVKDFFIGAQAVNIESNKTLLKLNCTSPEGVSLVGDISLPFSGHPFAKMHLIAQSSSIKSILKRNHTIAELDSGFFDVLFLGGLDDFEADVSTAFKTKNVEGDLLGVLRKYEQDSNFVYWKCNRKSLKINGIDLGFAAAGSICKDSMVIDTLNIAGGVNGKGTLLLGREPFDLEINCDVLFPIKNILAMNPQWASIDLTGTLNGHSRVTGTINQPNIRSEIHIRDLGSGSFSGIETDAIITWNAAGLCVQPIVLRKNNRILASFDTIKAVNTTFSLSGDFENIDLRSVISTILPRDLNLESHMSGTIASSGKGFPIAIKCSSPSVVCNKWKFDSVYISASLDKKGVAVRSINAQDGTLMRASGSGFIPWSLIDNNLNETDTIRANIDAHGDFLSYLAKNVESPIAGKGLGTAKISFISTPGALKFTEGSIVIPEGVLTLHPFVLDDIKNFSFSMNVDDALNVHTNIAGTVKHRPITISSTHTVPDGFEPFIIGPFNFGMLEVKTPEKGIDIHLPGFMPIGELGDIEFKGKNPVEHFTLSGPLEKLKISGTWVLRDVDFTFPFLNTNEMPWEFDLFPYITWDLDLKTGNRRVLYFWDLSGKRRRLMRFLEGYLDPTSIVKVRGRDMDYTFRLYGQIRSLKGALYYGKTFDRNFDVGLDFVPIKIRENRGYDNLPIIWGSAEALSDTSRLNRIKVTCMVHDPATNAISEKGRLVEGKSLNVSFQLSNDFEGQPGESEHEFFRQAGLSFSSLGGAGGLVSDFGEQFFHRYLLQRWERKLAKKVGVDVINIESSITSNYFSKLYSRQFEGLVDQDDYLALANLGITVGRYFFHDFLFFKARGELVPIDTLLTPEYSIGMEFQPHRYFIMDFNYGVHKGEEQLEHDPRVMMQLTLPMTRIRKLLKF